MWIPFLITASIIAILIARDTFLHGDVSKCEINYGKSELYTHEELKYAVDTVEEYFKEHFAGCKLKRIRYGGDNNDEGYSLSDINANRGHIKYSKMIVLYIDFKTDDTKYSSFEPNHLYTDFVLY